MCTLHIKEEEPGRTYIYSNCSCQASMYVTFASELAKSYAQEEGEVHALQGTDSHRWYVCMERRDKWSLKGGSTWYKLKHAQQGDKYVLPGTVAQYGGSAPCDKEGGWVGHRTWLTMTNRGGTGRVYCRTVADCNMMRACAAQG